MNSEDLTWTPIGSDTIFSTRVFDVHELKSRSPEQETKTFYALHANDWVIVVPVLENSIGEKSFLMVRQWRHGAKRICVEFPGGVIDDGEKPEDAARRELLEETGRTAKRMVHAATLSPNPAIMENAVHVFFAEELANTNSLDLDDDEYVTSEAIRVNDVIAQMGHGEYKHALMASALMLWIQKNGYPA